MKVYKLRDPKTGEFYTGGLYSTKITSKNGKVYLTPATVKAALTRFNYSVKGKNLLNDFDMEVVEYDLVEVSVKTISELKKMNEDKQLIDRGTYYEIKDYEPIVNRDENGNVVSVINCPYIPKFLVDETPKGNL